MLLILLIIAAGGVPLVENPNSTLLNAHPRFRHIVELLRKQGISPLVYFEVGGMFCIFYLKVCVCV